MKYKKEGNVLIPKTFKRKKRRKKFSYIAIEASAIVLLCFIILNLIVFSYIVSKV